MEIKSIEINDISRLSPLQPEGWFDIIPLFDFYSKSSFCFPMKAIINNEIIGVGSVVIHDDVAWFAHVIVHSGYRCKGIGLQIVQTLVEIAKENNCSTIYLIATDLGEPVYKKVGFVTETEYFVYKNVVKKDYIISDCIYPYEEKHKECIMVLDRDVSGESRMMHLKEHLADCQVYVQNDRVEGSYMPTLGEGLIIANSEKTGIELLKLHLKHKDRVVFPKNNQAAQKFLEETGFGEMNVIKRMRLGKEREVRFAKIYNRIGGNVG